MNLFEKIREGNPIPGWFLGDNRISDWPKPVQAIIDLISVLVSGNDGSKKS